MIVYREVERLVEPRQQLAECERLMDAIAFGRATDHGLVVRALIELGELEAAVADRLFPTDDGLSAIARLWRRAALAFGHVFVVSWLQRGPEQLRAAAGRALARIAPLARSLTEGALRLRVTEGYAYYALYPETYVAAATLFRSGRLPDTAICIGLRSIGTSLSAVVGAELEAAGWRVIPLTLRPRGHPFERRPNLTRELADWMTSERRAQFLIVDEGPGISGSSFCGVAETLSELGIADERISLFPSWPADGGTFNSERWRERWQRHQRYWCSFEQAWLKRGFLGRELEDLCGGAWRSGSYTDAADYPAVHPQHERRKYRAALASGEQILFKFAGLGRYGAVKYARAESLADAGYTPPVLGLRDGFLMHRFVTGRPLDVGDVDARLLRTAAEYLAHLRRHSVEESCVAFESLSEMIEVNVAEGLGPLWRDRLGDIERFRPTLSDAPAIGVDGRMMPHEWLATKRGIVKVDATDHGDDHFFPGPQDVAWDVAGFAMEFDLSAQRAADFADQVASLSGDLCLRARLPFYRVAYLACRLGYTTLAVQTLGQSEDAARMAKLAQRYARQLRQGIRALGSTPRSLSVPIVRGADAPTRAKVAGERFL